ncbi:hypothetical protein CAB17_20130 (plasmid) [Legionella sainthelensi]|uniref:Uncharacterized protein n=1 Tax=Legionella sainthelensi TaxID=28087 RepID=A0A2H5FRW3_9GAMM|nr:hypothetical protein CAB17_20130 [Legionella sainthelensi]
MFRVLNNKILYENEIYTLNDQIFSQEKFNIIKNVYKIRNCFAHNNGVLKGEKIQEMKKTIKALHQNYYFKINDDLILIEKGALHFITQTMRNFFDEILKK